MRIATLFLIYLFFFNSLISCCKTIPPDPPDPPDTTKAPLTLLWKNNFDSTPGVSDSIFHSQNPLIYDGDIV